MSSSTCSGKDLKSALQCSQCKKPHTASKLLPCCHAVCPECLEIHRHGESADSDANFCPVCKHGFSPPEDLLNWLPSGEFLDRLARVKNSSGEATKQCDICSKMKKSSDATVYCRECIQYLCNNCQSLHNSFMGDTRTHKIWALDELAGIAEESDEDSVSCCSKHSEKELELYCSECSALICVKCQLADHQNHKCRMIGDVAKETRKLLKETQNRMENIANELQQNRQPLNVDGQITDVEKRIKKRCENLRAQISSSEEFLLNELNRIKDGDKRETDAKNADMKRLTDRTDGLVKSISLLLEYGKDSEIAGTSDRLEKGAEGLIELYSRKSDKGKTEKQLKFIEPPNVALEKIVQTIGRIEYSEISNRSYWIGYFLICGLVSALVIGFVAGLFIRGFSNVHDDKANVYDFTSSSCAIRSLQPEQKPLITGVTVVGDDIFVIRRDSSEINQYDLKSLEFKRGINIPSMKSPYAIVAATGYGSEVIYIHDASGECIFKVDPSNYATTSWTIQTKAVKSGLSVSPSHSLIISAYKEGEGGMILEYDTNGKLISELPLDEKITSPDRVVKIPKGLFVVSQFSSSDINAGSKLHQVCILDSARAIIRCHNRQARNDERSFLRKPSVITFDKKRSVLYVADVTNNKVVILGSNLEFIGEVSALPNNRKPWTVFYHEPSDQLFVGYLDGGLLIVNPPTSLDPGVHSTTSDPSVPEDQGVNTDSDVHTDPGVPAEPVLPADPGAPADPGVQAGPNVQVNSEL